MEISLFPKNALRIKGKHASLMVNPAGKISGVNGILLLGNVPMDKEAVEDGIVVLKGPGEYETGGIKITGLQNSAGTFFSILVDGVEVLLGRYEVLEKDYSKIKEHHIVVLACDTGGNPSFITSFTPNVALFYGERAEETIKHLVKEGLRTETKYQTTREKLPQEMEEILLQ